MSRFVTETAKHLANYSHRRESGPDHSAGTPRDVPSESPGRERDPPRRHSPVRHCSLALRVAQVRVAARHRVCKGYCGPFRVAVRNDIDRRLRAGSKRCRSAVRLLESYSRVRPPRQNRSSRAMPKPERLTAEDGATCVLPEVLEAQRRSLSAAWASVCITLHFDAAKRAPVTASTRIEHESAEQAFTIRRRCGRRR